MVTAVFNFWAHYAEICYELIKKRNFGCSAFLCVWGGVGVSVCLPQHFFVVFFQLQERI